MRLLHRAIDFNLQFIVTIHSLNLRALRRKLHISMIDSNNPMIFAMEAPHTQFPSPMSFGPPAIHTNDSLHSLDLMSCQTGTSSNLYNVQFESQNNLSMANASQFPLQTIRSSTRKRAPKAPTISAEKWRPCENRMKQLYVSGDQSIKELREIIFKEFGLMAT